MHKLAQDSIGNPALGPKLQGFLGGSDPGFTFIGTLVPNLITLAFIIAAIIFVFTFIAGAIGWIGSGGDKGAIESARGKITSAIIGMVILFALFAIIKVVEYFFGGTNILKLDIGILKIQ